MKKLFGFFVLTLLTTLAFAQTNPQPVVTQPITPAVTPATPPAEVVDNIPKTTIEFKELEFDFGTIKQGEKAEHTFKFKNTGKNPLIINSAKGSCGCTVPTWPKEPVMPGATGEIHVVFNSAGKSGQQTKPVTIMANTDPNPSRITMKGTVEIPATAVNPATPAVPATPATNTTVSQKGKANKAATTKVKPAPTAPASENVSKEDAKKMAKEAKLKAKEAKKAAKEAKKAAQKMAKEAEKKANEAAKTVGSQK